MLQADVCQGDDATLSLAHEMSGGIRSAWQVGSSLTGENSETGGH